MHEMKLRSKYFDSIKSGIKTVEIRLYDEKRRKIKENDTIEFTDIETNEKLDVIVTKLDLFKTFKELFEFYDNRLLGFDNEKEDYNEMYNFYSKEEEHKYGVVGINIKLKKGDR